MIVLLIALLVITIIMVKWLYTKPHAYYCGNLVYWDDIVNSWVCSFCGRNWGPDMHMKRRVSNFPVIVQPTEFWSLGDIETFGLAIYELGEINDV